MPIDPAYPAQRQAFMIQDTGIHILLTDTLDRAASFASQLPHLLTFADDEWFRKRRSDNILTPVASDALFHVLYTSGSTGDPKGVCGTHEQMHSRLQWLWDAFPVDEDDIFCHKTTLHFVDASLEIFGTLLQGRPLVILPESSATNPEEFLQILGDNSVTRIFLVVSHLRALLLAAPNLGQLLPKLKLCVVSGERLTRQLVEEFQKTVPQAILANLYGCTEVPEISWVNLPPSFDFAGDSAPIGYPISGSEIYIVDETLAQVAPGEVGELLVGSSLQSRGYLNRPADTEARFIVNPFVNPYANPYGGASRLYRTGDRVRSLADGLLNYVGRVDHQVKIRGYRVELPEVESALQADQSVEMGVVVVQEDPELAENKQLVAFVTPECVDVASLREKMQTQLPAYMLPQRIIALDQLPLTLSGKVNRQALLGSLKPIEMPAAVSSSKEILTQLWSRVLQAEQVGLHDNFFDVGGDSLRLVQLHQKLGEHFGSRAPTITTLLQYSTIDALTHYLDQAGIAPLPSVSRRLMQDDHQQEIAIIGMACRFPGAATPAEFWQNLRMGVESISSFSDAELTQNDPALRTDPNYVKAGAILADIAGFDAEFFGISAKEAELLDPQQRLLLECAWEALEQAGYAPDGYPGRVGVYAGSSMSNYFLNNVASKRPFTEASLQEFQANLANDRNFLSTRISYKLNLQGPSVNVQTACSTGLVAVHIACQSLQVGDCELALAGSVALRVPQKSGYLYQEGMIRSPDGRCRAFDAQAQGTIFGNGAGIVVLKPLAAAQADGDNILAVIKGGAINNDGAGKVGFTAPSYERQVAVIEDALAVADVDASTITYVEAHGTGTKLGDPIEIAALTQAFDSSSDEQLPRQYCAVGSVKTNIGHLDEAAGIAGLIKTALALKHQEIPPSLHFQQPNPEIDFENSPFYVKTELSDWSTNGHPRRAGVSSFGMGGTNSHLVLEEAPVTPVVTTSVVPSGPERLKSSLRVRDKHLLTLSAKTPQALEQLAQRYVDYLASFAAQEAGLANICFTANSGRKHFNHRAAFVAESNEQLRTELERFLNTGAHGQEADSFSIKLPSPDPSFVRTSVGGGKGGGRIAFLFTGQGSQYVNMGRQLYESQPIFRQTIDRCDEILHPYLSRSLLSVLYPEPGQPSPINETEYTQPALFALEYALYQVWKSWGIEPFAVMGHSVGEYVAACVAGVFSLEDGLKLIAERGRLMQALPLAPQNWGGPRGGGEMVAIAADEQQIRAIIAPYRDTVSIAAINGPESLVISGHHTALQAIIEQLKTHKIKHRRLNVSHAFHSPLMDPMLDAFRKVAAQVTRTACQPTIALVSNVTGALVSEEVTQPDYWVKHISAPVRFADSVQILQTQNIEALIEMGPKPILLGMASQIYDSAPDSASYPLMLPTLRAGQNNWAQTLDSLGQLYTQGFDIDWRGFYREQKLRKVSLPTYPFQRSRYWVDQGNVPDDSRQNGSAQSGTLHSQKTWLTESNLPKLTERLTARGRLTAEEARLLPRMLALLTQEYQAEQALETIRESFYEVEWQPKALSMPQSGWQTELNGDKPADYWIICADHSGVGEALAAVAADAGYAPILIYRGQTLQSQSPNRWTLDPNQPDHLMSVWQHIHAVQPTADVHSIVHLWSLDAAVPSEWAASGLMDAQQWGCGSVLGLLHLLSGLKQRATPRLWLVTQGAQSIHAADPICNLAQVTLWGMGRTIALEHAPHWGGLIDLMPGQQAAENVQALFAELLAVSSNHSRDEQIALRQDGRYVARLKPVEADPSFLGTSLANPISLQEEATYLITGGLGGLGLEIARGLAEQGARHLVLTSRRGVTTPEQAAKVAKLEEMDVQLYLAQADVADEKAMTTLFAKLEHGCALSFPPLRGIIHAAGFSEQDSSALPDWSRFAQVLAPKVVGSWHLHRLSQDMDLDFFVLFSSASSLLGLMGQSDYAAANAFLDALAAYRQQFGLPALSISWGDWAEVGMAATRSVAQSQSAQQSTTAQMANPLQIAEGVAAFQHLLARQGHIGVMQIDWQRFVDLMQAHHAFLAHCLVSAEDGQPDTIAHAGAAVDQSDRRNQLAQVSVAERSTLLTRYLSQAAIQVLGLPPTATIDQEQNLLALGYDSLMLIEMSQHIRQMWGVQIELPRLLQGITLHDMVEELLAQLDFADHASEEHEGEEEWLTVTF